jgi:membrane-associated protease RseP (regulator of RpoE activity)
MSSDNGRSDAPIELLESRIPQPPEVAEQSPLRRRPIWLALILFLLTVLSTLAVGAQFALAYANNQAPFSGDDNLFTAFLVPFVHPRLLILGIPFSFTLLAILLAHELGHYFTCRYYGIDASYPYFIPAPTIIGTMGAFIRIRSPIVNRKALFDVGLSGPVVGFLFAVPALALGILFSKVVPGAQADSSIVFGNPPLVKIFMALFRPGVAPEDLLLHPVGRAAWVGLFATALNLLPSGQLDGGHIVYSLASEKHRLISVAVALGLLPLAYFWPGWAFWAVLLLLLGFRHPPLLDRWEPVDKKRRAWAVIALVIFLLCFTPAPFTLH